MTIVLSSTSTSTTILVVWSFYAIKHSTIGELNKNKKIKTFKKVKRSFLKHLKKVKTKQTKKILKVTCWVQGNF